MLIGIMRIVNWVVVLITNSLLMIWVFIIVLGLMLYYWYVVGVIICVSSSITVVYLSSHFHESSHFHVSSNVSSNSFNDVIAFNANCQTVYNAISVHVTLILP